MVARSYTCLILIRQSDLGDPAKMLAVLLLETGDLHNIVPYGKKVNQSHYRPEVPRGFQEVKVPSLRNNGPGWW